MQEATATVNRNPSSRMYYSNLKVYTAYCLCLHCGTYHYVKQTLPQTRLQHVNCPACKRSLFGVSEEGEGSPKAQSKSRVKR
jgi:Zn finger protein HypA/HybF involved in hydrogenase expression